MQSKGGKEASDSINHRLSQLRNADQSRVHGGFIHKVHDHLRNISRTAYEPNIVAIGPYHHHKESCKMMEDHKLRYLQSILDRRGETTAELNISAIEELMEQEARNCYAESINLSRDKFIEMLILDGCFIIELVHKFKDDDENYSGDPLFHTQWMLSSLRRDLMLFENQIPFFVLCKLFDLIEGPNQRSTLIKLLINFCKGHFPDRECKNQKNSNCSEGDVKHLLDLIECKNQKNSNCSEGDVKHLLDLIYRWWIPESFDGAINLDIDNPIQVNSESRFIHSVAELKDANVKFKKRETCDSLFGVKFHNGTLQMPTLTIDDGTDCFFRNLIAYEQYFPGVRRHSYFTDYVGFLDLLINSSNDVDILTECGIINSCLGDNGVIANMINRLNDSIVVSAKHVYGETFRDINTHYKKRWNRWMAVLNHVYFSSPWSCISFFAAFVLLVLTIIQTVLSILQFV